MFPNDRSYRWLKKGARKRTNDIKEVTPPFQHPSLAVRR